MTVINTFLVTLARPWVSVAMTCRVKVPPLVTWVASLTVMFPELSIANAPAPVPLPPTIEYEATESPKSGSEAVTAPPGTAVPWAEPEFNDLEIELPAKTGASFTLVKLIVTVLVAVRPPASVTCTVRPNVGVVSKSSLLELATVMTPAALIAKAPRLLPHVMLNVLVSPASTSLASTAPTVVPFAVFSGTENV